MADNVWGALQGPCEGRGRRASVAAMRPALSAVAVLCAACGGGLNPEFGGQWSGTATTTVGSSTAGGPITLTVDVDGTRASVTPLCSGASGTLTLVGEGSEAQWSGSLTCPAVQSSCGPVAFSYQSATLSLGTSLRLEAQGQATGCGRTERYTLSFVGTRR